MIEFIRFEKYARSSSFETNLFFEEKKTRTICLLFSCPTGKEKMDNKMKPAQPVSSHWLAMTFTPPIFTPPPLFSLLDRCNQQDGVEVKECDFQGLVMQDMAATALLSCPVFSYPPSLPFLHPSLTWLWGTSATTSQQHPRWPTVRPICQWPCDWATLKVNPLPSVEPLADIVPATSRQTDPELEALRWAAPSPHKLWDVACGLQPGVMCYAATDKE